MKILVPLGYSGTFADHAVEPTFDAECHVPTLVFTESGKFTLTHGFSETQNFQETSGFHATQYFTASSQFILTAGFTRSESFTKGITSPPIDTTSMSESLSPSLSESLSESHQESQSTSATHCATTPDTPSETASNSDVQVTTHVLTSELQPTTETKPEHSQSVSSETAKNNPNSQSISIAPDETESQAHSINEHSSKAEPLPGVTSISVTEHERTQPQTQPQTASESSLAHHPDQSTSVHVTHVRETDLRDDSSSLVQAVVQASTSGVPGITASISVGGGGGGGDSGESGKGSKIGMIIGIVVGVIALIVIVIVVVWCLVIRKRKDSNTSGTSDGCEFQAETAMEVTGDHDDTAPFDTEQLATSGNALFSNNDAEADAFSGSFEEMADDLFEEPQ